MIYAVDFDGTLCKSRWPDIGEANEPLISFLKEKREQGDKLILWTMREGELLSQALDWCNLFNLTFDAVNDNLEEQYSRYGHNSRKVYADFYLDDHNLDCSFLNGKDGEE